MVLAGQELQSYSDVTVTLPEDEIKKEKASVSRGLAHLEKSSSAVNIEERAKREAEISCIQRGRV